MPFVRRISLPGMVSAQRRLIYDRAAHVNSSDITSIPVLASIFLADFARENGDFGVDVASFSEGVVRVAGMKNRLAARQRDLLARASGTGEAGEYMPASPRQGALLTRRKPPAVAKHFCHVNCYVAE